MRPVNLIPQDQRTGAAAATGKSGIAGYIIIGALLIAIAALSYITLLGNDIDDHKAEIASLEGQVQEAQAEATALQPYVELATVRQARSTTIDSLAKSRFDWVRVLRQLARITPASVSLSSLTGTVAPSVEVEGAVAVPLRDQVAGPALEIEGCVPSQRDLADFIASLQDIDGVTRVAAQTSQKPRAEDEEEAATADSAAPEGTSGAECSRPKDASFQMVAAFDEVPTPSVSDAPTGSVTVTSTSTSGTDGGVAAEQSSQAQQQQQISNASQRSEDAADLVPGG